LINSNEHRQKRLDEIAKAIMSYSDDRKLWQQALKDIAEI